MISKQFFIISRRRLVKRMLVHELIDNDKPRLKKGAGCTFLSRRDMMICEASLWLVTLVAGGVFEYKKYLYENCFKELVAETGFEPVTFGL
jgi:hypothetical protein